MRRESLFIISIIICLTCNGQQQRKSDVSFLLLGDIHYDLIENHDSIWLASKPDDWRQVTKEYTQFTKNNWKDFSQIIQQKVNAPCNTIKGVLQMGDLSEGLAGTPEKARQMANSLFEAVEAMNLKVPMMIAKGNHDITGPGAKEAFDEIYLPNMAKLAGLPALSSANYSKQLGNMLFVCFDPWEQGDVLATLERMLSHSKAKYKFVLLHEPIIPINERCWHVYRKEDEKRERLLKIIASQKAIVLCAHLHLFSVVRRDTQWGPIVQIMVNSVIKNKQTHLPSDVRTTYDTSLVTSHPKWEPATMEQRIKWIEKETPHIKFFKRYDLPGYGILTIDERKEVLTLQYFAPFKETPYDTIDISKINHY